MSAYVWFIESTLPCFRSSVPSLPLVSEFTNQTFLLECMLLPQSLEALLD